MYTWCAEYTWCTGQCTLGAPSTLDAQGAMRVYKLVVLRLLHTHTHTQTAMDIKVANLHKGLMESVDYVKGHSSVENFKLTTMTVLVSLSHNVSLKRIRSFDFDGVENVFLVKCGFYNSVLLKLKKDTNGATTSDTETREGRGQATTGSEVTRDVDKENSHYIAVKVFLNGNLHMTGVDSLDMAVHAGGYMCNLLNVICETDVYEIHDIDIQLINCCFRWMLPEDKSIGLKMLFRHILDESKHFTILNNDTHAGLRIKIVYTPLFHTSSIILFENGNVLINAFVCGEELCNTFNYLAEKLSTDEFLSDCLQKEKVHTFNYMDYLVLR
ncbi:hypothetical protein EB077_12055 [bacterium]|nr:hypothetical protein [bacterium]